MYKCVVCGKEFESEAVIVPPNVYCQKCGEKIEEIQREFEIQFLEAELYKKPLPNIDEHVKKHKGKIEKLKLSEDWFKLRILQRCVAHRRSII